MVRNLEEDYKNICLTFLSRATFAVTNTFAILDLFNSRRNAKNHHEQPAPEMTDASNGTAANNPESAV